MSIAFIIEHLISYFFGSAMDRDVSFDEVIHLTKFRHQHFFSGLQTDKMTGLLFINTRLMQTIVHLASITPPLQKE